MFFSLLKVQLKMMFLGLFKTNNSKRSSTVTKVVLFSLLYLFVFVYLGISIGAIFLLCGYSLASTASVDLYFPIAILLSTMFGMMGTMMSAEKLLFDGKDNDLLLSMPIPPSYILTTRLVSLAMLESAFSLVILLPAVIAFYLMNGITLLSLFAGVMGIISMLVFPLVFSIILGRVLSEIHSRAKNKKLVDTMSYFLFFVLYLVVAYNISPLIEYISVNGPSILGMLKNFAPLLWWGNAMIYGDVLSLIGMIFGSGITLVVAVYLLSRGYSKLISRSKNSYKKQYKERSVKSRSPIKAFLSMELGRFFGTPLYLFNCGLGMMLSVLASIMFVTNSEMLLLEGLFDGIGFIKPALIIMVMMFISSTICPACVSISIEGKFFHMIKTFPISTRDFLKTKILMNVIVASPNYILLPLIAGIGLKLSVLDVISIMIFGFVYQLFLSTSGLLVNLKMPKMEWTNVAMVVKQSASVTTMTLSSMALTVFNAIALFAMLYFIDIFFFGLSFLAILIMTVIYASLFLVCVLLLRKYGEKLIGKI